MKFASLGTLPAHVFDAHSIQNYADETTLLESSDSINSIDALILAPPFDNDENILHTLRQHPEHYLIPIFTLSSSPFTELCDGSCENENQVIKTIERLSQRTQLIKQHPLDARNRFLAYCYVRAPLHLKPHKDWHNASYYIYPLISLFLPETVNLSQWLEECTQKNLFTQEKFMGGQFVCNACQNAYLSFTERCPNCHDEQIVSLLFLHCFACGLIAPENDFIREGRFQCPKCHSVLRHIGNDYDRPLESGQCLHCQTYYQESELWVRCMICNKEYSPDKLGKNTYYLYTVSEENAENILNRYFTQNLQIFDDIHYMEPSFFMALLDWLLALNRRYPEEEFSLIGLWLPLSTEITPFLQPFAEHLKTILRQTDILTRLMENEIWLLLPKTNQEGLDTLLSRLPEIKSHFPETSSLTWKQASLNSANIPPNIKMETILIELRTQFS